MACPATILAQDSAALSFALGWAHGLSCCEEILSSRRLEFGGYFTVNGDYLPRLGPLPSAPTTSPGAVRAGAALRANREGRARLRLLGLHRRRRRGIRLHRVRPDPHQVEC